MNADGAYTLATAKLAVTKDVRLDKFLEFLDRDITFQAGLGKLAYLVDYTDKVVTEAFVFQITENLLSRNFKIIYDEDESDYRRFIVSWDETPQGPPSFPTTPTTGTN